MFASGKSASVSAVANYIEDVFSTYLYTGNGSTQTITNGIDLSTKGGLVWIKRRNDAYSNVLYDTSRGVNLSLSSNTTAAQLNQAPDGVSAFNTTGFSLNGNSHLDNNTTGTYASWTFREQAKFFDVVTYTGNGTAGTTIPHNLGSAPGCILVKKTSGTDAWAVYHRGVNSGTGNGLLVLNTTAAQNTNGQFWWGDNTNFIAPTSTNFTVSNDGQVNASGATYVAYLFAHDAGGFGLTGSDNVISCGSSVGGGSAGDVTVNLGYEPQWVLLKNITTTNAALGKWELIDNMRGWPDSSAGENYLVANSSAAEATGGYWTGHPTATGFTHYANAGETYIYIAIRRGPMKVPTTGTTVFQPLTRSGTGGATTITSTVRPDTVLQNWRSGGLGSADHFMYDRLRGVAQALFTDTTDAESTQTATGINAFNNLSYGIAGAGSMNNGSALYADYVFTRAPSFFDEVCYTGNSTAGTTQAHNLGVAPELIIIKMRSSTGFTDQWVVGSSALPSWGRYLGLNLTDAINPTDSSGPFNTTAPTASVFTLGGWRETNGSGYNLVAYLFATCAGVSKVGSYTGTATTKQVDCGFTAGARFVLIKRTDSTGDWYVWDTARGIVSGNDPYLLLNSTAAEVASTDYIDAYSAGFEISSTAPSAINASGGTFIFLAIA